MKRVLASLAIFPLMTGFADARPTQWLGYFCITSNPLPQACIDDGIALGECATLRYTPPNIANPDGSNNGPATRFNIFEQHWAEGYVLPSGTMVGTQQTVNGTGLAAGTYAFTAQMKIAQSPATPTATTANITMTGTINGYDGTPNCNIKFRAAVTLRPPN